MEELVEILHRENCSCVIRKDCRVTLCRQRGVRDLLEIIVSGNKLLEGAEIADKVIGKGAAALMILGGVRSVYADVISEAACDFLQAASVPVSYGLLVPNIINRSGTGICPVEMLCGPCATPEECLPLIEEFVSGQAVQQSK